ncbi:hypothetical protein KIN20_010701 [Parelaphostrongylus tenuis]|uniref:Uncharacterized protein n=1 Tax=Parelaphostrongylus tenuis TaxID=148309 RepID=A0AAD5M9Z7_PARTN|nr:hypothetical protein KIN20_010694 [Parelaphostrongylus tenuis]KAJ1353923.1 hypothetical protein KIN20_010701 [Parelaphostrongylus tenuis]
MLCWTPAAASSKGRDGRWLHIGGPIANYMSTLKRALCASSLPSSSSSESCGVCTFLSMLVSDSSPVSSSALTA